MKFQKLSVKCWITKLSSLITLTGSDYYSWRIFDGQIRKKATSNGIFNFFFRLVIMLTE